MSVGDVIPLTRRTVFAFVECPGNNCGELVEMAGRSTCGKRDWLPQGRCPGCGHIPNPREEDQMAADAETVYVSAGGTPHVG